MGSSDRARLRHLLRSPRLALSTLAYLAVYAAAFGWAPWRISATKIAPAVVESLGLHEPFSSPFFVAGVVILFASTLVCTIDRTHLTLQQWRGVSTRRGVALPRRSSGALEDYLIDRGFQRRGDVFFRFRTALWGGWILHVGLLALILGVAVQQTFHDSGAFELSIGESAHLRDPGVVFGRSAGWLAPNDPPDLDVGLLDFDPFLHQPGYASDRASRIQVSGSGGEAQVSAVDRARGVSTGLTNVFQAIPSGLALNIRFPDGTIRSIHLRQEMPNTASSEVTSSTGRMIRFGAVSERPFSDRLGTGRISAWVEAGSGATDLTIGGDFPFGDERAQFVEFTWWSGFTYSRSPGLPLVFASFAIMLVGCILLVFPAGIAHLAPHGEEVAGWIWMKRGTEVLRDEWENDHDETRARQEDD